MQPTVVLNIVGLTPSLIGEHTPKLKAFRNRNACARLQEPFPAVTCTSQATMLTGKLPQEHGIVGNGWYFKDLAEVGFWKQSNSLIQGEKIYDTLKSRPGFTCAKLFWWYNMYSGADWSVTPRPHYPADGRKVFDVYTHPMVLHDPLVKDLGPFPFPAFWGPMAGIGSSEWIAACAKWTHENKHPTLSLVYLPHLDYCLQKFGPGAPEIPAELQRIDTVAGDLIEYFEKQNVKVLVVSEYGITKVSRHTDPNRILRRAGLLEVRPSVTWELLDAGASRAFAVSDHQICHIYVHDKSKLNQVVSLFEKEPGTRQVIHGEERKKYGLDHDRAGDVILMAEPDNWYTYYFWEDDKLAPDFARCVEIHRKPGYDPVELFMDPKNPFVKGKAAMALLKKKLGFRYYMDVIPLDASLIKGSHGTPADDPAEAPLLICDASLVNATSMPMTAVRDVIARAVTG
ncbi:MAG TPA: alkaline phosphatase family protein [Fibrobacteres bacterium]|nr:alkaline phosphatase family protein [Fibrobacterota bacterium]